MADDWSDINPDTSSTSTMAPAAKDDWSDMSPAKSDDWSDMSAKADDWSDMAPQPEQTPVTATSTNRDYNINGTNPEYNAIVNEVPMAKNPNALDFLATGIARGMKRTGNILDSGMNAVGDIYNKEFGLNDTTAGVKQVYNAPKTALEWAAQKEQLGENGLKRLIDRAGGNPATPEAPAWRDVFSRMPDLKNLPPETLNALGLIAEPTLDPMWAVSPGGKLAKGVEAEKAGMLHPNIGNAYNAGQRGAVVVGGHDIVPQFIGKPVMNALGGTQKGLRMAIPGLHTMTDDPLANRIIEDTLKSPQSHASHVADITYKPAEKMVAQEAEKMGITPEELHRRMADYLEPPSSETKTSVNSAEPTIISNAHEAQMASINKAIDDLRTRLENHPDRALIDKVLTGGEDETHQLLAKIAGGGGNGQIEDVAAHAPSQPGILSESQAIPGGQGLGGEIENGGVGSSPNAPTGIPSNNELARQQIGQGLPENIRQYLDNQIKSNRGMALNEGLGENDFYHHHSGSAEWQKFKDENFNKQAKGTGSQSPKSDDIAAHDERQIKMTANEANDLFAKGRGDEVFPNSTQKETLKQFRGPIFDQNVVRTQANRFLQNAKVNRVGDFMKTIEKTHGISPEAHDAGIGNGSIKAKDYTPVKSDHFEGGEKWFPKQIADFIDGVQNPKQAEMLNGWSKNWLENTSTLTKLVNFGLKPASAPFNYLSNLNLQYLNKNFSPTNVAKGMKIVANERMGKLGDKVVLHSPKYGDITEKQLMEMARAHRGIGMGIEKSEIANSALPNALRDNKLSKGAMAVHMFAEDASRLPAFMTELEKGATWEGAAQKTRETLYDYDNIGKTDKKIAQYIPFYRFARLNMPTMVKRMMENPARTFAVEKTRQAWNKQNNQEDNENILPDFERMEEPWAAGKDENGNPRWVEGGRYNTQNDINRPFGAADQEGNFHPGKNILRYMASMVNPFVKTPVEEAANMNTATGTPIARNEHANMGLGENVNLLPGLNMPSKAAYAFNQFSPFSMARVTADQSVPLPYRLLHELGGVKAFTQEPDVDRMYKTNAGKKDIEGLKGNMRLFMTKYQSDLAAGKTANAKMDMDNYNDAYQDYLKYSQKVLEGLGQ